MTVPTDNEVTDLSCVDHEERQRCAISARGLTLAAAKLGTGGKFRRIGRIWQPRPYAGVAVVSMVDEGRENASTVAAINALRTRLADELDTEACYLLPVDSYHQTIANTFSGERYQRHIIDGGHQQVYPTLLHQAFAEFDAPDSEAPKMQLIGLALFGAAFGLLGIFANVEHYQRIASLRQQFYGYQPLRALGLVRTRPFIAHVTLGYFERELDRRQREHIVDLFTEINRTLGEKPLGFLMRRAQARCYDHLATFVPRPEYPTFNFIGDAS
jgi:hypothetical protein